MKKIIVTILLCVFLCFFAYLFLDVVCNKNGNDVQIQKDIEFVQFRFPQIKDIKSVKYYYLKKSGGREIGLEDIEFVGLIQIGDEFLKKLASEYEWKETDVKPKKKLTKGDSKKYTFCYSYEFNTDGKYRTMSYTGSFYLDIGNKTLYFELEYS